MSRDVSPRIRRRIVRNRLHGLQSKMLDEPNRSLGIGVCKVQGLQLGDEGLECGDVVSLDAPTVDVLMKTLDTGISERSLSIEKGRSGKIFPRDFSDILFDRLEINQGLNQSSAFRQWPSIDGVNEEVLLERSCLVPEIQIPV